MNERYPDVMDDREVLRLLLFGIYKVDLKTAEITGPSKKKITPFPDKAGYMLVRLYNKQKRRGIMRSKLVWMAGAMSLVPDDFEVHHEDESVANDVWDNLFCFHKLDHGKKHGKKTDEVPF